MLEVLRHHGPARLGRFTFQDMILRTPGLLPLPAGEGEPAVADQGSLFLPQETAGPGILPDFPCGLDVPREIAEFAVEETIRAAEGYPDFPAVVQGGRYPELRRRCARELGDRPFLVIADGAKLVRRPRVLVEVLPAVREEAGPNTALYLPHAPAAWFPILAYMGVDLFDGLSARVSARQGLMETTAGPVDVRGLRELPCRCAACADRDPEELGYRGLLEHNLNEAARECAGIREAIRAGTLRNLVETRASAQVEMMAALRLLDRDHSAFLERYTPVRP
ncbi:MAG: tRNA-guanine transglycosylase [Euryarchaeota archaeon]|nr:tRNA-guanine transglycosylase [Euryarchaeota archaeon]